MKDFSAKLIALTTQFVHILPSQNIKPIENGFSGWKCGGSKEVQKPINNRRIQLIRVTKILKLETKCYFWKKASSTL